MRTFDNKILLNKHVLRQRCLRLGVVHRIRIPGTVSETNPETDINGHCVWPNVRWFERQKLNTLLYQFRDSFESVSGQTR